MNTLKNIFKTLSKVAGSASTLTSASASTSISTSTLTLTLTLTLISTLTLFHSCEKPDRNNPWDDEATFDQQQYAPQNLAIEANTATQVTLTWDYDEIEPGGFAIARKENDGSWTEDFATTQEKTFTDTNANLLENSYEYRVHTFYRANTSSATEIMKIAPPTVTTQPVTDILAQSAKSGGTATEIAISVNSRGVVWGNTSNPELPESKDLETKSYNGHTTDGSGEGTYESTLTGLMPQTSYYLRAYVTTPIGIFYGNEVTFETPELTTPSVTTNPITNVTTNSATGGGNVTSSGGATVTARGIAYGTSQNPTISGNTVSAGSGTGSFTDNMTGLQSGTTYYVRAYATNSEGTAYGEQLQFETNWFKDVTNPTTGKTWMDRNLGATRVAQSSTDDQAYGHLYQWGRGADGHQIRTSGTTSTLSDSNTPGHGNFILTPDSPHDWRSPQNDNLWQGVNSINNPCPEGYRLPTEAELNAELQSWSSNNPAGAFASPLKLPVAGYRSHSDGSLLNVGSLGYYWSSTVSSTYSRFLLFYSSSAGMGSGSRAYGYSVRCLKD